PFGAGGTALLVLGIGLAVVLVLVLILALTYISSRMRFVLFDTVVHGECRIREYWSRRSEPALRYFLFQILFGLAGLISVGVLIGTPLLFAFSRGWHLN